MKVVMRGFFDDPTGERESRAILAATTSSRAGGTVLPEARGYNLPPMLTGLEIFQMGREAWEAMAEAANWYNPVHMDVAINLDHPDVKAAL
jgi:hypothetical protein